MQRTGYSLFLILPVILFFVGIVFSRISFTSASLLLEFGVFLSCIEWIIRDKPPLRYPRYYAAFLVICFFLSYNLRWKLTLYFLAFIVPSGFSIKKSQLRKIVPFLMLLSLLIGIDQLLFHLNNTPGHKDYVNYTELQLRYEFFDTFKGTDHGESTLRALEKVGWTSSDYWFYRYWIIYDDKLFNASTLKVFLEENNPQKSLDEWINLIWTSWRTNIAKIRHPLLMLLFSMLALITFRYRSFRRFPVKMQLKIIATLGAITAGALFVMFYGFQSRVAIPLFTFALSILFLMTSPEKEHRNDKLMTLSTFAAALFLSFALWHGYKEGVSRLTSAAYLKGTKTYISRCLEAVQRTYSPLIVIMNPTRGIGIEGVNPLKEASDFPPVKMFPYGWEINSPRYYRFLKSLGLENGREFLQWMVNRSDVLLVLFSLDPEETWLIENMWVSYYNRRVMPGGRVQLRIAYDFRNSNGAGLVMYRIEAL